MTRVDKQSETGDMPVKRMRLRRAVTAILVAATASFGVSVLDAPTAAAHIIVPIPSAGIDPSPHPPADCSGTDTSDDAFATRERFDDTCQNAAVAALNNARSVMGLPPYTLPANFTSLPLADQILMLVNQDRAAYGIAPYIGYNSELNHSAQASAAQYSDPTMVRNVHNTDDSGALTTSAVSNARTTSVAAVGGSPLYSYYDWIYNDGYQHNRDCPEPNSPGCWGHRRSLLYDAGSVVKLVAGIGYSGSGQIITFLGQSFQADATVPFMPGIWSATQQGSTHQVRLTGSGFSGISAVTVNGASVTWHIIDAHTLDIRVPDAASAVIAVTTNHGWYQNADHSITTYTYTSAPFTFAGLANTTPNTVTVTAPSDQSGYVGQSVSLPVSASDTDNDPYTGATITYSASGLPTGLSIDPASGVISGTPSANTGGTPVQVGVTATDDTGASSSATFAWNVSDANVTITAPSDQSSVNGSVVSLPISAVSHGAGTLTYTATGLPTGLSIDPASGVISGTLTTTGSSPVTVTATGSAGPSASATFAWAVTSRPITITAIPDQANSRTQNVTLAVNATGPDSGTLTYAATGLPDGLSIDPASGVITGTPTTDNTYPVSVTVTGQDGQSQSTSFTWTVAPNTITVTVTAQTPQVVVGQPATLIAQASNSDPHAAMHYSVDTLPPGLALDPATGLISGTPAVAGQTQSLITVADATTSTTTGYTFVVDPAPTVTKLTASRNVVVNSGSPTTLTVLATDASGAAITATPVTLQYRAAHAPDWTTAGSFTTDSAGHAFSVVRPAANTSYRWTLAATSTMTASTSPVSTVLVRQVVRIAATRAWVRHGARISVYGSVSPNERGQYVNLYRYYAHAWHYVTRARVLVQTGPTGGRATIYMIKLVLTRRGSYVFRASRAATTANGSGVSRVITIRAR